MPKVTINNTTVEAPEGATILDAAKAARAHIPTLCHAQGTKPLESCFVCAVRVVGQTKFLPACSTPVRDGMVVATDTPEVHAARKAAVELLLSDHLGECLAPCQMACPTGWNIPEFMEAAGEGDWPAAAAIARRGLALPGVLGCFCAAGCQKACRRAERGEAVSIRELHRFVAGLPTPSKAPQEPGAAKVAVVGTGPAGLAAAFALADRGCAVACFDAAAAPGGSLRELDPTELPPAVLDADLDAVAAAGVAFHMNRRIASPNELTETFDAVLLATGAGKKAVLVDKAAHTTATEGVFAAGACAGREGAAVRVVADGLAAAKSIHRFITSPSDLSPTRLVNLRYGPLSADEQDALFARAANPAAEAGAVDEEAEAEAEARRCLLCGCRENDRCKLRKLATELGADPRRYAGQRRRLARDDSHPQIVYEANKCILCGACVALAAARGDALTIVGRGFAGRISAPYEGRMADALGDDAAAYADICPTSAFHRKTRNQDNPA